MASQRQGECPERGSAATESKGRTFHLLESLLKTFPDDGIVVVVWFVYVLRCADGFLYIGETSDVAARIAKHNEGCASLFTARP
jgi:hypothetical protein